MSDLLRCGRHHIERNHAKNYKGQNENQTTAAGSFLFRLRLFILVIFIRRLYIHTFMNDCLLDNRLPNFCIHSSRYLPITAKTMITFCWIVARLLEC